MTCLYPTVYAVFSFFFITCSKWISNGGIIRLLMQNYASKQPPNSEREISKMD